MNRTITITVTILMSFSTWFNSAPIYARAHSKFVANSGTIFIPDNYTRIQWAIGNASAGDTIFVREGTYCEHVVVDKALSLIGENKHNTTIDGNRTGIVVYVTANNITLSNFTIQNGEFGIWFSRSSNNILTDNTASNNNYGIYVWGSSNNILNGNTASNNNYGIYVWGSSNNILTDNTASDNQYGIYLSDSDNNALLDNVVSNNQHGIYLDGSGYNTLTGSTVSSNYYSGILLHHSSNNAFNGNIVSNKNYGIYLSDSGNNAFTGNIVSNNKWGTYLYYSPDNILTGDIVSSNYYGIRLTSSSNNNALTGSTVSSNYYGIRLTSSSNNIIYHNNFINNTETASSIDSANFWDNGAEGNYWSDHDSHDANWDGIVDTPYPIYENNQDNYPLMATFLQFIIIKKNQSYNIDTVSSSTILNLQYRHDPDNKINAVSFKVNGTEGKGFCRINIAHALIYPPYTVTVDKNSPLYFGIVYTNGTHTWLYFTYDPLEQEVTITHTPYPEQLLLSQWAIFGLTISIIILLSININYYRKLNKQKKVIEIYESELRSFPLSHPERAHLRFIKDVIERKEKIEKFEKKYGINIQPAGTLEDLMEKLGVKRES